MNISDEQKDMLLLYVPEAKESLTTDDVDDLLDKLDDRIIEIGFDKNWDLNSVGLKLQRLYDQIWVQN